MGATGAEVAAGAELAARLDEVFEATVGPSFIDGIGGI
jgi:hypothetical protein